MQPLDDRLHSDHCRACKERVGELLTAIYGACRVNASFPWSSRPQDYDHTPIGELLQRIRAALATWRGHGDFIRAAIMPPCDFYVDDPPFILEFDESQHFARARLITLELYPETAELGFSVQRWRELCRTIAAVDDEPFDRDERRAWYDTCATGCRDCMDFARRCESTRASIRSARFAPNPRPTRACFTA